MKTHLIDKSHAWGVLCGQLTTWYGKGAEKIGTTDPTKVTCMKCFDRMTTLGFVEWSGAYVKRYYDVLVPKTDEIVKCWPNAGLMNALDGSGRSWSFEDHIKVRKHVEVAS